ncbi:MAG: hypothetical protein PF637_06025 [Spirochaetes bacterium]|jgi:hypothetical protein|nr:hypothetical protein [Spirochaetota bacterium]
MISKRVVYQAKKHASMFCKNGLKVRLVKIKDNEPVEEKFGGTPARNQSSPRLRANRAGWVENCDIVIYIAKLDVDKRNLTFSHLKTFERMYVGKRIYDIEHVNYHMNIGDDYLYYIIGGRNER